MFGGDAGVGQRLVRHEGGEFVGYFETADFDHFCEPCPGVLVGSD